MNGIALDGGAMRTAFFAGFLCKIQETGHEVDQLVGVSGGALVAMGYVLGIDMRKSWEIQAEWIIENKYEINFYRKYLDAFDHMIDRQSLEKLNKKLTVVASHVSWRGIVSESFNEFKDLEDLKQKLIASGAIPVLSAFPAQVADKYYIDGYFTCQNPASYLSTRNKLTVIAIPELAQVRKARDLGDVVIMDSYVGHNLLNTFVAKKESLQDWFDFGYRKAHEYLESEERRLFSP